MIQHFSFANVNLLFRPLNTILSSRVISDLSSAQLEALSTPDPAATAEYTDLTAHLAEVKAAVARAHEFYEQETPQGRETHTLDDVSLIGTVPSKRGLSAAEMD